MLVLTSIFAFLVFIASYLQYKELQIKESNSDISRTISCVCKQNTSK